MYIQKITKLIKYQSFKKIHLQ